MTYPLLSFVTYLLPVIQCFHVTLLKGAWQTVSVMLYLQASLFRNKGQSLYAAAVNGSRHQALQKSGEFIQCFMMGDAREGSVRALARSLCCVLGRDTLL